MERPAGVIFPEKTTSLEISDMSLIISDVFSACFGDTSNEIFKASGKRLVLVPKRLL